MINQSHTKKYRERNRVLLLFYDVVILLLVWLVVMVGHPSSAVPFNTSSLIAVLVLSLVCFTAARLMLRVYKVILRNGTLSPFARELAATTLAGVVLLIIGRCFLKASLPFTSLVSYVVSYIVVSVFARVVYFYLYQFARGENRASKALRGIMTRLTLVDFDSNEDGALMRLVLEPAHNVAQPINEIQNIVDRFAIRGDVTSITQINKGYINQTYRVDTLSDRGHVHKYTLQRINTNVFRDVDALMDNYKLTTDHLFGKFLLPGHNKKGSVQMVRVTKDGLPYLRADSGCWRMMTYFDGVYSLDIPDDPKTFYYAGKAFGKFIKEMSDVDIDDVKIVIPNFHNTRSRYNDLEEAVIRDPKGRVKDVARELQFVRARKDNFGMITDALDSGRIPTRVCHNDCNLNNILFDEESHLPVAIIDLDTVMPSSPLYDYGDSMRIGTNTAIDDEKDLSKVSCDLKLYETYARGYLEECGEMLTREELQLLPYASLIITAEDGIRFLMDHINGDTYYNIYYPGQNLDRSRTQLALLEDMERKLPRIVDILEGIYKDLHLEVKLDKKEIVARWQVTEESGRSFLPPVKATG